MFITALAPLGAKYKLQFVPEYNADGTVTVSIIYSLKTKDEDDDVVPKTISFTGTPAEVDAALVDQLPKFVGKLVAHATSLEELDAQLEAEKAAKKEGDKKTTIKSKVEEKKPEPAAKSKGKKPATKEEPAAKEEPPAPPEPPKPGAVTPPGLTPAWKGAKPASEPAAPPSMANVPAAATGATAVAAVGAPDKPAESDGEDLGSLFPA